MHRNTKSPWHERHSRATTPDVNTHTNRTVRLPVTSLNGSCFKGTDVLCGRNHQLPIGLHSCCFPTSPDINIAMQNVLVSPHLFLAPRFAPADL